MFILCFSYLDHLAPQSGDKSGGFLQLASPFPNASPINPGYSTRVHTSDGEHGSCVQHVWTPSRFASEHHHVHLVTSVQHHWYLIAPSWARLRLSLRCRSISLTLEPYADLSLARQLALCPTWFAPSVFYSLPGRPNRRCRLLPAHLFTCSVLSLSAKQELKKKDKNIFSFPDKSSGFMLITFSHDYNGQKVIRWSRTAMIYTFSLLRQTDKQRRKNSSRQLLSQPPLQDGWRTLKEKKAFPPSNTKNPQWEIISINSSLISTLHAGENLTAGR